MWEVDSDTGSRSTSSDGLRRKQGWDPEAESLASQMDELDEVLAEEEEGCALPSTPEDQHLLDAEMAEVLKAGVLSDEIDLGTLAHNAAEQAEEFVRKVWEASWNVCHFRHLPRWLQDNDYLHKSHRPPLPSFSACFASIFRIHTETADWLPDVGDAPTGLEKNHTRNTCYAKIELHEVSFGNHYSTEPGEQDTMRTVTALCLLAVVGAALCRNTRHRRNADLEAAASNKWEKGGGGEHYGDHHGEHGDHGDKGYKGFHEHDFGKKGHSDHEGHKGYYGEDGGHKKHHHHDDGYYGEHNYGEKGEKGQGFEEKGHYHKGHDTKGYHGIHKIDEFKKDKHFHDKHGESGFEEEYGGHHHEGGYKEGGHFAKGHKDGGFHEHGHGSKGHHEKGGHHHDHKGHHDEGGHDEYYGHHSDHGDKGGHEEHKGWGWKKGHK
ncbi:hypothetical protein K1T71_008747 [Dendrolimus kikuchii]|uniref:Uncharacterized protein n=1 Tax=Dendrolimus kikuchii TaxID=765133 RepID=A0ACC1CW97_9NEOP|nr:hypothetical protein K1T71_008747 [Dendrolimus kikuchii]